MWEKIESWVNIKQMKKSLSFFQETTKEIELKIEILENNIERNALWVKEDIDKIFKNSEQNNFLKWKKLKISLLQIKAKALSKLWEINKTIEIYDEITKVINNELYLSFNQNQNQNQNREIKKEMIRRNSIEKLDLIIENLWNFFNNRNNITTEEKNELESIFLSEIEKLKKYNLKDIWLYYFWLFHANLWNGQEAEQLIEQSAILWNKEAIIVHLWAITEYFISYYNSYEKEDKEKFKNANIKSIEEEYNKFIEQVPELHKNLWNFFEKIDENKKALEEYKKFISFAEANNDILSQISWYEKLWDNRKISETIPNSKKYFFVKKSKEWNCKLVNQNWKEKIKEKTSDDYYNKAIDLFDNNVFKIEKYCRIFLEISSKLWIKIEKSELYQLENILLNKDYKNITYLANYYENIWDYKASIEHYLTGYEFYRQQNLWINKTIEENIWKKISLYQLNKIENQNNHLNNFIIFLRYSFNNKLKNNKNIEVKSLEEKFKINLLIKEELGNSIQSVKENYEKNKEILKQIINKADNKDELSTSELAFLFSNSLNDNFNQDITLQDIKNYINWYNNNNVYWQHIFLQIVLKKLSSSWIFNEKLIKKLISKVYKREIINEAILLNDIENSFEQPDITSNNFEKNEEKELNINEKFIELIIEYNNKNIKDKNYYLEIVYFLETNLKEQFRKENKELQEKIQALKLEKKLIKWDLKKADKNNKKLLKPSYKNAKYHLSSLEKNLEANIWNIWKINVLIKEIKSKKEIYDKDISLLFDYTVDDDYYFNFDINNLSYYINLYNKKTPSINIILTHILTNLESQHDISSIFLKPFFNKIKNQKELDTEDISDLFDIFNPIFEKEKENMKIQNNFLWVTEQDDNNTFKYTLLINDIIKKSKK